MNHFEDIRIKKEMYEDKMGFSDVLERLDPSENYIGTSLEGLDAFSRQLKRFDIKVSGEESDCVEKFFKCQESSILFPEYVRRSVELGMKYEDNISQIVAITTNAENMDYRHIITLKEIENDKKQNILPENNVKIYKRGKKISSSYEILRFQRLNLFTIFLNNIGNYIAREQFKDAINILMNGDGDNSNVITTECRSHISYNDIINLYVSLKPYNLNTIIAPKEAIKEILSLPKIKVINKENDFQNKNKMIISVNGIELTLLCSNELVYNKSIVLNKIIGLDNRYSLEMIKLGDIKVDYEKLINKEFDDIYINFSSGFSKIFQDASLILKFY